MSPLGKWDGSEEESVDIGTASTPLNGERMENIRIRAASRQNRSGIMKLRIGELMENALREQTRGIGLAFYNLD